MFELLSLHERIQNAKTTVNTIVKAVNRESRNAAQTVFPFPIAVSVAIKPLLVVLIPPDEVALATTLPFHPPSH
jgi:hypothetical protein